MEEKILLGRTELQMIDTMMGRYIRSWNGRRGYAGIVGLVEGDDVLGKAEESLENKIETGVEFRFREPLRIASKCSAFEMK